MQHLINSSQKSPAPVPSQIVTTNASQDILSIQKAIEAKQ